MESGHMKVYTTPDSYVALACPECGKMKKEQAQNYKFSHDPVKIQCKCGTVYEVEIEFRRLFRKKTSLKGIYSAGSTVGNWGEIVVMDVSMQGCKFETLKSNRLKSNEEIKIEFRLNNIKNSVIRKRAFVRHVTQNYIGCEFFKEQTGTLDPDLGFYLREF